MTRENAAAWGEAAALWARSPEGRAAIARSLAQAQRLAEEFARAERLPAGWQDWEIR
jgi:hypothetical protein